MNDKKVLLIVTDGLGYSSKIQSLILDNVLSELSEEVKHLIFSKPFEIHKEMQQLVPNCDKLTLARVAISPVPQEIMPAGISSETAKELLILIAKFKHTLPQTVRTTICKMIEIEAKKQKYIPWLTLYESYNLLRSNNLSIPTKASGEEVGFNCLIPEVQGNSETGHLHIAATEIVPQNELLITKSIDNGTFFSHDKLVRSINEAISKKRRIHFAFLLSGTCGTDGKVHSSWNHLEAFVKLLFEILKVEPENVSMLAILDGRDSEPRSSVIANKEKIGNYLQLLNDLLEFYRAKSVLTWVVGRAVAMDRDFQEINATTTWEMLNGKSETYFDDFNELIEKVKDFHKKDFTDQNIPPIIKSNANANHIQDGDVFINLNFRSDRQRMITALLLNATDYLMAEAQLRKRNWLFQWKTSNHSIKVVSLSNYHKLFNQHKNYLVCLDDEPVEINLFQTVLDKFPEASYALVGESVKSSHMGYFIRGKRDEPINKSRETRFILSSPSIEQGVANDSQYYKVPEMSMRDVSQQTKKLLAKGKDKVIACNFAGADMLGHLLPALNLCLVVAAEGDFSTMTVTSKAPTLLARKRVKRRLQLHPLVNQLQAACLMMKEISLANHLLHRRTVAADRRSRWAVCPYLVTSHRHL